MDPIIRDRVLPEAKVELDTYLTEYGVLEVTDKYCVVIRYSRMESTLDGTRPCQNGPVKVFDQLTKPMVRHYAFWVADLLQAERDAKHPMLVGRSRG